jgi:hypothetical protein
MTVSLRPMNLGEILDRTFQIYKSRFWVFVGITALAPAAHLFLAVLGQVFGAVVDQTTLAFSTKSFLRTLLSDWPPGWTSGVVLCAIGPALTYVASSEFLGEKSSIRSALCQCGRRWRSWLFYSLIVWAIQYGIPAALKALIGGGRPGWGRARGTLLATTVDWLGDLALSAVVSFSAPAWIVEGLNVPPAILRGLRMARSSYGRLFAAWCLDTAFLWILGATVSAVMWTLARTILRGEGLGAAYRLFMFAPAYLSTVLALPIYPIAITLIYYDQRIRKEGYDIERMMDAAGLNESQVPVEALVEESVPPGRDSVRAEVQPG